MKSLAKKWLPYAEADLKIAQNSFSKKTKIQMDKFTYSLALPAGDREAF